MAGRTYIIEHAHALPCHVLQMDNKLRLDVEIVDGDRNRFGERFDLVEGEIYGTWGKKSISHVDRGNFNNATSIRAK